MTINKRTQIVPPRPASEREIVDSVKCDLCSVTTLNEPGIDDKVDWLPDVYDFDQTAIIRQTGARYPSGGHLEKRAYHICPACRGEKLEPWLIQQGAAPTVEGEELYG